MTDPIETALRTMLRERAADIMQVPAAVADLEHARPSREDPVRHPRRSWFLVAASIAAVIAVAAAVAGIHRVTGHRPVAAPTPSATTPNPPATRPPTTYGAGAILQWSFAMSPPSGYQLLDRALTPTFQTASLRLVNDPDAVGCCGSLPRTVFVTVYAAGAFDARGVTTGTRFDVGAIHGYYGVRPPGLVDSHTKIGDVALPTVSWPYAPDAWATVQAETPTTQQPDQLRRVTAAVRPTSASTLRIPLRLGHVAQGLAVSQVTDQAEGYGTRLDLSDGKVGADVTTDLAIQIWGDAGPHQDLAGATTVGGRPGRLIADSLGASVVIGTREVVFSYDGPHASKAELTKILNAVQWAPDPADVSTWFDAKTSLP